VARTKAAAPYHHGDLRGALVALAAEEVARGSAEGLTLREVARGAGVSHAAAYRHFSSKAALLAEVAREGFVRFAAALEAGAAAGRDLRARLVGLGRGYVTFATTEPGTFRLMWSPALKPFDQFPGLAEAAGVALEALHHALADEALGVPARDAAMVVWSAFHGHAMLGADRQLEGPFGVRDPMQTIDTIADALVKGLEARKATTARTATGASGSRSGTTRRR